MSFFKEFKEDLSTAVNELLPGEDLEEEDEMEESSEMMVNTLEGELDIESELSKLDGLLEHVDGQEEAKEVKHVELTPEDPVLEQLPQLEPEKPKKEAGRGSGREAAESPKESSKDSSLDSMKESQKESESLKGSSMDSRKESPKEGSKGSFGESTKENSRENARENLKSSAKESPQNASISRFSSLFDLDDEKEEEIHFSFDADLEKMEPAAKQASARPAAAKPVSARPAAETASSNIFNNHRTMQTSKTIKEEVPMNEEMTKETMAAAMMEEEFKAVPSEEITDEVSIITNGTTIKGNLSTTGSFSINGRIEGNVQCNGKLEVTGTIKGNSTSSEVFSDAAKIEGEITSTGTVKIGLGSVVVGNITATSAVIAGAVKGDIDVQGPVVVDTSAVIVGNIKSRSVQINNGAVIEGFCSQCYADIDVDSLFGDKKGKQ